MRCELTYFALGYHLLEDGQDLETFPAVRIQADLSVSSALRRSFRGSSRRRALGHLMCGWVHFAPVPRLTLAIPVRGDMLNIEMRTHALCLVYRGEPRDRQPSASVGQAHTSGNEWQTLAERADRLIPNFLAG